ncbi:hypothetical protein ACHAXT_002919 [Thalassiosira profunda]
MAPNDGPATSAAAKAGTARPLTPAQHAAIAALPSNNTCAECRASHPDWASVTFGITLCLECAGAHRGLGVHLSFVRSLTMDDWTEEQYGKMMGGGNARWREYWQAHGGEKEEGEWGNYDGGGMMPRMRAKYESGVATKYREALSANDASGGTADSAGTAPSPSPVVRSLPADPPPSFDDLLRSQAWPFVLSTISTRKSKLMCVMWVAMGLSCAYGAHLWGKGSNNVTSSLPSVNPSAQGQMGAAVSESNGHYDVIALGIIAFTAAIPYLLLRPFAHKVAKGLLLNRQAAFKSARNLLMERIFLGRAQRLERCDVYYPTVSERQEAKAKYGLIFYPGALVDRAAYAPIATLLSEAGILVAVANLEPHRVVAKLADYPLKEKLMHILSDSVLLSSQGVWSVDAWAIGGHSMGGHLAIAAMANELSSTMKKVVLWGVLSFPDPGSYPCKQTLRETDGVYALVVNGSEDKISTSTAYGKDKEKIFWEKMPPKVSPGTAPPSKRGCTQHVIVEGGNHSGCAHYGPQTFPLPDGVRTITLEEQQRQFANTTLDFLLDEAIKRD